MFNTKDLWIMEGKGPEFTNREIQRLEQEIEDIKLSTVVNYDSIYFLRMKIKDLKQKPYARVVYSYFS